MRLTYCSCALVTAQPVACGVLEGLVLRVSTLLVTGLDAEWEQEAELWIKLRDFKWLEELKSVSAMSRNH